MVLTRKNLYFYYLFYYDVELQALHFLFILSFYLFRIMVLNELDGQFKEQNQQSNELLRQKSSCSISSNDAENASELDVDSNGVQSFFPTVMRNWVSIYVQSLELPHLLNNYESLAFYLNFRFLVIP